MTLDIKTAEEYHSELNRYPPLKSGNKYIDTLLDGGLRSGLIHLFVGNRKTNTDILMRTAVMSFLPGQRITGKVVYIDANNRFSPYFLSQLALSKNLSPQHILQNIYIARAFQWTQMVELMEEKLVQMQDVRLVLISGLTAMFEPLSDRKGKEGTLNQRSFDQLKGAIQGMKTAMKKSNAAVVITVPKHPNSIHKPFGGKIISHFGCVIVEIFEQERRTDYFLAQHPFMGPKKVTKWNRITDQIQEKYSKWYLDSETETKEDSNPKDPSKEWKGMMQTTLQTEISREVNRLRLKAKRNKTNRKGQNDKTSNMSLDYYLEANIKEDRK
jgi:RecA/RadA recombinase